MYGLIWKEKDRMSGITCQHMVSGEEANVTNVTNVTSFELSKAIYTSGILNKVKLSPSARLILIALSNHYNPKKKDVYPSMEYIAEHTGVSLRQVERLMPEIKNAGLVVYETKKVNHYKFTSKFFSLVGLSVTPRQYVGQVPRQYVGQTNNHEQIKNSNSFKESFSNRRPYHYNNQKEGAKHKSPEQTKQELAKSFNGHRSSPMDDKECAIQWLGGLTPQQLKFKPIEQRAESVCQKWDLKLPENCVAC